VEPAILGTSGPVSSTATHDVTVYRRLQQTFARNMVNEPGKRAATALRIPVLCWKLLK
jgi:hypothetical protein